MFEQVRPRRRPGVEKHVSRVDKHKNGIPDFGVVQTDSISLVRTDCPRPETIGSLDEENARLYFADDSAEAVMRALRDIIRPLRGNRSRNNQKTRDT